MSLFRFLREILSDARALERRMHRMFRDFGHSGRSGSEPIGTGVNAKTTAGRSRKGRPKSCPGRDRTLPPSAR